MAGKKKHDSPLIEAAIAFDEALEAHARAAELFVRSSLSTMKQIERANELLGEIAAAEERLGVCGAALGAAVAAARDRQQAAAQEVIARLPHLKERNAQLQELLHAFQTLGVEAGAVNAAAAGSTPAEVVASVTAMSERAAALAAATCGVAVHGAAEASIDAADVFVRQPGLTPLVELLDGARATMRVLHRNLRVSLAYNLVGGSLAVAGLIHPLIAAVMMPLSSLTVLFSSSQNRGFRGPELR